MEPAGSRRGTVPAVPAASSYQVATVADEPAACNRGDRTDGTDGSRVRPVMQTVVYTTASCGNSPVSPHGLVINGEPREPERAVSRWGYVSRRRLRNSIVRREGSVQLGLFDWTWEGRRVRSSLG